MKDYKALIFCGIFALVWFGLKESVSANNLPDPYLGAHMLKPDTIPPIKDRIGNFLQNTSSNPFDLKDPKNIEQTLEYDPITGQYVISETIGENYFRAPSYMTFQEYLDYRAKQQQQNYFNALAGIGSEGGIVKDDPMGEYAVNTSLVERLFGGKEVDIRPQGNVDITFGGDYQKVDNPRMAQETASFWRI